jgi:hypothetical protein
LTGEDPSVEKPLTHPYIENTHLYIQILEFSMTVIEESEKGGAVTVWLMLGQDFLVAVVNF